MKLLKYFFVAICGLCLITSCTNNTKEDDIEYEITYYDGDEILDFEYVKKGEDAKGIDTTKEGYTFEGWDKSLTNIQSDMQVHGTWKEITYTVNFYNGDTLLKTMQVKPGENAVAPSVSRINGYILDWDKSYYKVTSDLDVYLVKTPSKYYVNFFDFDGNKVDTQLVEYQKSAVAPTITKENYELLGWKTDFSCVETDLDVYPIYKQVRATITYHFEDSVLNLAPATFKVGEVTELPKLSDDSYYFICWCLDEALTSRIDEVPTTCSGDLEVYAKVLYKEVKNNITLPEARYHFAEIHSVAASSGSSLTVFQPVMPVNESVTKFTWTTSDSTVATVSTWSSISIHGAGYCILTATSIDDPTYKINAIIKTTINSVTIATEEEANKADIVKVSFVNLDGHVFEEQYIVRGGSVMTPNPTKYDGYRFNGWDKDLFNITEDTTITATYVEGTDKYTGKYISFIGDSISTFNGWIPDGFAYFFPYPTADVNDPHMAWCLQVVDKIGGNLLVNNSYSGSLVNEVSWYASMKVQRLEYCSRQTIDPDILIIFMGSNDAHNLDADAFKKGYIQMLDNINVMYPNTEVILCTLPENKLTPEANRTKANEIIEEMATTYKLEVINLGKESLVGKTVDSGHPNYSGMQVIVNRVVSDLYEQE